MEYSFKEAGFILKSEIDQDIQTTADADAIEQAVLNLMSNAVKYSNSNKDIEVKLFSQDDSIFIQVADKGIGIPESEQKKIYEKFYRAHSGHERDTGGAGLGLTVVQHIVDAHNGKIELESNVGEGSTFTIILPKES
jgi:two-component system phosphate regulon sensor histidine kinase PhoR